MLRDLIIDIISWVEVDLKTKGEKESPPC